MKGLAGFNLIDAIEQNLECKIFKIKDSESENPLNWLVEPTELELIPYNDGHYLVKASIVSVNNSVETGFINLITPERIVDYVIYDLKKPKFSSIHEFVDKDVIPAVASDCFGWYELYYSKKDPAVGIDTLKAGLTISTQKSVIAEDLGYILRDENRLKEALEHFLISEKSTPSSNYIYGEIENIYLSLGNVEKAAEYKLKSEEK